MTRLPEDTFEEYAEEVKMLQFQEETREAEIYPSSSTALLPIYGVA